MGSMKFIIDILKEVKIMNNLGKQPQHFLSFWFLKHYHTGQRHCQFRFYFGLHFCRLSFIIGHSC